MSSFAIVQCEDGALSEADAIYLCLVGPYYKQDKVYAFSTVFFKLLGGLRPPRSLNKTSRIQCTLSITLKKDATSISSATVGLDKFKLYTHIPRPDLSNSYNKSLKYTRKRKGEITPLNEYLAVLGTSLTYIHGI